METNELSQSEVQRFQCAFSVLSFHYPLDALSPDCSSLKFGLDPPPFSKTYWSGYVSFTKIDAILPLDNGLWCHQEVQNSPALIYQLTKKQFLHMLDSLYPFLYKNSHDCSAVKARSFDQQVLRPENYCVFKHYHCLSVRLFLEDFLLPWHQQLKELLEVLQNLQTAFNLRKSILFYAIFACTQQLDNLQDTVAQDMALEVLISRLLSAELDIKNITEFIRCSGQFSILKFQDR